ncbi:RteC domain-containing protein [Sphingobacterium multivorum]|uniref:RteC domain-containing protein n=1 Tax=Sphingobacterium multivorum TaxID=28454 RepID=UPI0028A2CAAC|nr:RteC domain-containing protein [Sphingobacterium multivorum]
MTGYYKEAIDELELNLNELLYEDANPLVAYENSVLLVLDSIAALKQHVLKKGFENNQEEIHFFKHIKPQFVAKLIYYNSLYKIETKRPNGTKALRRYLNKEVKKLRRFFDNNLEFYKYYRTNNTYLDEKLFLRGKHDIKLSLDSFYFEADHSFSTSHDYKAAKVLANDLLRVYVEDQFNNNHQRRISANSPLNWTSSKTALIELIYALHLQGVFDNGNTDIKVIAQVFEQTFNISLGDFYHTFLELKSRKINRTKFIDSLRDTLLKKMEEQDEL